MNIKKILALLFIAISFVHIAGRSAVDITFANDDFLRYVGENSYYCLYFGVNKDVCRNGIKCWQIHDWFMYQENYINVLEDYKALYDAICRAGHRNAIVDFSYHWNNDAFFTTGWIDIYLSRDEVKRCKENAAATGFPNYDDI